MPFPKIWSPNSSGNPRLSGRQVHYTESHTNSILRTKTLLERSIIDRGTQIVDVQVQAEVSSEEMQKNLKSAHICPIYGPKRVQNPGNFDDFGWFCGRVAVWRPWVGPYGHEQPHTSGTHVL